MLKKNRFRGAILYSADCGLFIFKWLNYYRIAPRTEYNMRMTFKNLLKIKRCTNKNEIKTFCKLFKGMLKLINSDFLKYRI